MDRKKTASEYSKLFSQRLNYALQLRNMRQVDLVIKTGIDKSKISSYMSGRYMPKQDGIYTIAKVLNVNEAWLMGLENSMERELPKINNAFTNLTSIPILGRIPAGEPLLAEDHIEGYLPIDPSMYGINSTDDIFFLRVAGESMNKLVKNGSYVLIRKQDYAEDNDVVAAIVNGDNEATLKRFKDLGNGFIALKPESTYDEYIDRIINLKDTTFEIIGKVIGDFKKW